MEEKHRLDRLFVHVSRKYKQAARHLLEEHNVHWGQPPLMFALNKHPGLTNAELARILDVTPATISNMVKRMEKSGIVTRERDPDDERQIRVYLSDSGQQNCHDMHETLAEMEEILFYNFTAAEKDTLHQLLMKMFDNLENSLSEQ